MELDWLKIEPQQGQAGANTISVRVLSENDSLDREKTVRGVCGDAEAVLTVKQSGRRTVFRAVDGEFLLMNGETFNVLK